MDSHTHDYGCLHTHMDAVQSVYLTVQPLGMAEESFAMVFPFMHTGTLALTPLNCFKFKAGRLI